VKAEVHRLIVVDKEQRVAGIISLSDILKHLVLEPPALEEDRNGPTAIGVIFKTGDSCASIEEKAS
jgi:CBS domain-containing protein